MKHLSVVLILSVLVSCGGGNSSPNKGSAREEFKPCGGSKEMKFLCMKPLNWIFNTRLTNLPENLKITATYKRIDAEDYTFIVQDSCKMPGSLKIVSTGTGSSIFFSSLRLSTDMDVSLELTDLGDDCKGKTVLIQTDIKKDEIRSERTSTSATGSIDLD